MKRDLSEMIEKVAIESGADAVGVAGDAMLRDFSPLTIIEEFLPDARNVVIALVADPPRISSDISDKEYFMMAYATYQRADAAIFSVSEFLTKKGYKTRPVVREWPDARDSKGRIRRTVPLKQAAQAAGLGSIGISTLLVTPKWGPRVRLAGIITDAPLDAGEPMSLAVCDSCGTCARACPSGAIAAGGNEGLVRCSAYLFGGLNLNRLDSGFKEAPVGAVAGALKSIAGTASGWVESLSGGKRLHYNCGRCVQVCQANKRFAKRTQPKKTAAVDPKKK